MSRDMDNELLARFPGDSDDDDRQVRFLSTVVQCVDCDRKLEGYIAIDFGKPRPLWLLNWVGNWLRQHVPAVLVRCENCNDKSSG
jgi:hypothetical protein